MKDYKIYLLDFDGTLVDSEESLIHVFVEAYKKLDINVTKEQIRYLMRIPLSRGYKELNAPEDKHPQFREDITYLLNLPETVQLTKLYNDTLEFLDYLKNNNKVVGIVTGNNRKHFRDVLAYFGISEDYFSIFVGNEDIKIHKPNPDPILFALEKLNYHGDLKNVCYIGDAEMDAIAGTRAGVDAILLDRYDEYKNLPYQRIKSLKEMEK